MSSVPEDTSAQAQGQVHTTFCDETRAAPPRGRLVPLLDNDHPAAKQLMHDGYAVVRVCSAERAAALAAGLWTDLEGLETGIDRADPSTWTNDKWPQTTHGLLQNQGAGMWRGTCLARLETEAFWTALFGGKRCISSFDAVSVARPESQRRTMLAELSNQKKLGESGRLSSWCHTDQAKGKPESLTHIQGGLALVDLDATMQRTQVVVPKDSNETAQSLRDRFLAAFPPEPVAKGKYDPEREEWIKHSPAERAWLLEHGRLVAPTLKAGELFLWDSGVPHASIPGPCTVEHTSRDTRMSVFVSALPLELINEKDLERRREMLAQGVTSGHRVTAEGKTKKTPYLACKFADTGRTYGGAVPAYSKKRVVDVAADDEVARGIKRFCGGE